MALMAFGGERIRRAEVEVIVGKLKNGKDEVTGENDERWRWRGYDGKLDLEAV